MPYMADSRLQPDTLFFVAEENWRLSKEDAVFTSEQLWNLLVRPPAEVQEMPGEATISLDELYRLRTSVAPLQGEKAAGATYSPTDPELKKVASSDFYVRRRKPTSAELQNFSQELKDLVKICTNAHRWKGGGLVWLSWCGGGGRTTRTTGPCHGSTLLAVSAWFARHLLANFDKLKFRHFDIALRSVLQKPPADWRWCQTSFVYPSLGHYCEDVSGCQETLGWRRSAWDQRWCQEGTRKDPADPNQSHRTIHKFSEPWVRPQLLGTIVLPDRQSWGRDLRWYTFRMKLESLSPQRSGEPGANWGGVWSGPARSSRAQLPQSAGSDANPGPEGYRALRRLCAEDDPFVLKCIEPWQEPLTKRAKREHRKLWTNYWYRCFTNSPEAALVALPQGCVPPCASAPLQCERTGACCMQSGVRPRLVAGGGALHLWPWPCEGEPFAP